MTGKTVVFVALALAAFRPSDSTAQTPDTTRVYEAKEINVTRRVLRDSLSFELPLCCKPPVDPQTHDYFIDARTMETNNRSGYKDLKAVRVVLVHINPFRYEYNITANSSVIPEVDPSEIFALLMPSTIVAKRLPGLNIAQTPAGGAGGAPGVKPNASVDKSGAAPKCTATGALLYKGIASRLESDRKAIIAIDDAIARAEHRAALADTIRGNANDTLNTNNAFGADIWYYAARKAALNLDSIAAQNRRASKQAEADRDRVTRALVTRREEITQFTKNHPACNNPDLSKPAEVLATHAEELKEEVAKVSVSVDVTAKAALHYKVTGGSQQQYYRSETVYPEDISKIEIKVKQRAVGDKEFPSDPVLTRQLRSGGKSILSIAAGVMWSDMISEEYAVQKRKIDNSDVNMVVRTGRAAQRIVPMGTVNARPIRSTADWARVRTWSKYLRWLESIVDGAAHIPDDLHFSMGAGLDTDEINVEYFIGGGVNLFSNRLMLSVGRYAGRRNMLPTDLHVGDTVPDTTEASFRIDKSREWNWGVGVFYNLRK